jgi:8-oxo-dGTP diphosphatase
MTKTIRCSVAAVVRREAGGPLLAVRRPLDDDSLPGVWGLPAVTLKEGELPEEGLRRLGAEKLKVELEPSRFIGIKAAERDTYQLILMDIEAIVVSGEPDVLSATTPSTRYIDQRWVDDLETFVEAARRGSLCAQVLLDASSFEY